MKKNSKATNSFINEERICKVIRNTVRCYFREKLKQMDKSNLPIDYDDLAKTNALCFFAETAFVSMKIEDGFCFLYALNPTAFTSKDELFKMIGKVISKGFCLRMAVGVYRVDSEIDLGKGIYSMLGPELEKEKKQIKKLKIYLSGPISIDKEEYKRHFKKVEDYLTDLGWEVINPADDKYEKAIVVCDTKDRWGPEAWLEFIKRDMDLVSECDAICMLTDWTYSPGANVELITARKFGLDILYEEDLING